MTLTLSVRRQKMSKQKTNNSTKGQDCIADFEYRRDVVNDIEDILLKSELLSSPPSDDEDDDIGIDSVLVRRVAEDIAFYIIN